MKRILIVGLLAACSGCALAGKVGMGRKSDDTLDRSLSLARLSERHGNVQQAEHIYNKIAANHPKESLPHHRLGVIAAKRGDFEAAERSFAAAQAAGLKSADLLCDIAYMHYMKNDLAAAERTLQAALMADSQHKRSQNTLGLVLAESGRFPEALAAFRHAVEEPEALSNLAYVQVQLGAIAEAEKNYHRALELNHGLKSAAEGLLQLASIQGKPARPVRPSAPTSPNAQPDARVELVKHDPTEVRGQANPTLNMADNPSPNLGPNAPSSSADARQVSVQTLHDPRVRTISREIPFSGVDNRGYVAAAARGPGAEPSLTPQGFSPTPQPPQSLMPSRHASWPTSPMTAAPASAPVHAIEPPQAAGSNPGALAGSQLIP